MRLLMVQVAIPVSLGRRDVHSSMLSTTTRWNISPKHSEFAGLFGSLGMVVMVDTIYDASAN